MKLKTTSVNLKDEEDEKLFVSRASADEEEDTFAGSDDDGEVEDETSHTRLLLDMKKISRKKVEIRRDVRSSLGVGTTTVNRQNILKRLKVSSLDKATQKLKTLSKPLETTVAQRAKRAAGFEKVVTEVNKWAKVVDLRRKADQVTFPLEQEDLRVKTLEKVEPLKLRTPLEQEVYSLLQGAKLIEKKTETEEERAMKRALSLQQVKEQNREMWRQKELKRRYEQKAMMQNKSKSKKYHRLLRREKLKKQKAEIEQLQKTDPEAALEKLEEMERARVQERMTLRHKKSKWAHLQSFRATKDKNAMAALKENHRMHNELTAKIADHAEGADDDNTKEITAKLKESEEAIEAGTNDPMNPWINNLKKAKHLKQGENDESFTKFKKFWEEVNSRKLSEKKIQEQLDKQDDEKDKEEEEEEEEIKDEEEKEEESGEEEMEDKEEEKGKEEEKEEKNEESAEGDDRREVSKDVKGKLPKEGTSENLTVINEEGKETEKVSKTKNVQDDAANEMVSIDDMFDKAEIGIKNRVKRKLEKLGVNTKSGKGWKKMKKKRKSKDVSSNVPVTIEEFDFSCKNDQDNIDERLERLKTLEDIDSVQENDASDLQKAVDTLKKGTAVEDSSKELSMAASHKNASHRKVELDPTKFLQVDGKRLMSAMPNNVTQDGEGLDDDEDEEIEDAEDIIREAFADDYLIDEFKSEKAAAIERNKLKITTLALPGWGDWTGPNIKMSNNKRKKFRVHVPRAPKRKDSTMGHVIYNEQADVHDNLRKAMVSDLPHPFKRVKDFEASVRAPIGRMFVPETVHKKLTAPPVVTKMGAVIEPMTEEELLKHKCGGTSANQSKKNKKGLKVKKNKTFQTQTKEKNRKQMKSRKKKRKQ